MRPRQGVRVRRIEYGVLRSRAANKIRGHLLLKGFTLVDFAQEIGVSKQIVSATVRGEKHSPLVLDKLREYGVPERYLHDPSRASQERAA